MLRLEQTPTENMPTSEQRITGVNAPTVAKQEERQEQTVEELLAIIAKERRKRKKITRALQIGVGSVVSLMLLGMVATWIHTGKFPHDFMNIWGSFGGLAGLAAAASSGQRKATRSLAQFEDMRAVGPLAESLELGDKEMRKVATEALIRLLPQLNASDAHQLNDEQRKCLHRTLYRRVYDFDEMRLALAVLKAMEQVGDERDLAAVERAANETGKREKSNQVQQAAQECLPALRQRAEEGRARSSLLRAAGAGEITSEHLVRPVSAPIQEDASTLLRACLRDGQLVEQAKPELIRQILREVETTYDHNALPYVERVADSEAIDPDLREAARRCLTRLRFQTDAETETNSLMAARS